MKVLLATDGSQPAVDAARFLSRLPHPDPLSVVVNTSIVFPTPQGAGASSTLPENFEEIQTVQANEHFAEIEALFAGADAALSHSVTRGHAGECLVELAEEFDVDLVVLGAKGHSMVHRILLGSVSDYVATHAKCSVLIVRPAKTDSQQLSVLIGYDGSPGSEAAMEQFSQFRWGSATGVHLLNVTPIIRSFGRDIVPDAVFDLAVQRDAALRKLKQAAEVIHAVAPNANLHVVESEHIGDSIVSFAENHSTDLVLIGDTGRSAIGRMLIGSVSRYVLRHASCSVWIARAT